MRNIILLFAILLFTACQQKRTPKQDSVNAIIGDVSYIETFGVSPTSDCDEQLRIKTHLSYVEQLLRRQNTNHLSVVQRKQRALLLDYLHEYHEAGIFPKNYDYKDERRPCFIDKDDNICAVGYLVAKTAGIEAARAINSKYKYATIAEMDSDFLSHWIKSTGLSTTEIAMIQPNYGFRNKNYVTPEYRDGSGLLHTANIGLTTIGLVSSKPKNKRRLARLGILSGALTLGYTGYRHAFMDYFPNTDADRQLGRINTLLGVATIGVNTFQLLQNKRTHHEKGISWNLNIQPGISDKPMVGLVMNKKL